jgi:hypothetical protein
VPLPELFELIGGHSLPNTTRLSGPPRLGTSRRGTDIGGMWGSGIGPQRHGRYPSAR